jgi:hypothetical protein
VVVLEPSCASVFRDEMLNLFLENSDAVRLSRQTLLLSEFRFSCREQIAQGAKRHTFYLAEILDLAFKVTAQDHRVAPARPPRAA